jgi:hydrogenase nickel incorporation protein HypA/HybF
MHEVALAYSIVELIEAAALAQRFTRVKRVHLAIGALATVEPAALAFGFDSVSLGTVAEGAQLRIERPAGAAYCMGCGVTTALTRRGESCRGCGSYHVVVTEGDELKVTHLEVE